MVLLSIFFTRISPRRDHQQIVLYSFCRSLQHLHLAVKILLQIFLYEDLSTLTLHTSVGCISSRMPADLLFCNQYVSENVLIFDINHQQNTRRSDQIETIKTIMQTTRLVSWKVLPMAQLPFFKKIFDQVRKDLDCELFILNKTSQRLTL